MDNTGREREEELFEIIRSPRKLDDLNGADDDGSQYLIITLLGIVQILGAVIFFILIIWLARGAYDLEQGLFSLSAGIVRHSFYLTNPEEI